MKRRSREINIFSMSALDLFASALGAFILIAMVLFPFFPNTGDSPERLADVRAELRSAEQALEESRAELTQTQGQLDAALSTIAELQALVAEMQADLGAAQNSVTQLQGELSQCQASLQSAADDLELMQGVEQELESCRIALQQTFVLVVISWSTNDDVDLHIVDPRGNEYYYAERRFAGSNAALEEDTTNGPGNEIWLSPSAMPGTYEVYLNMYSKRDSQAAVVRGAILHQGGRQSLRDTSLRSTGEKPLVATFVVDEEGNVTVR